MAVDTEPGDCGRRAWVTAYDVVAGGWVSEVDLVAERVVGERVPVGFLPEDVAVTPDGARVLVVNGNQDTVSIVDSFAHRVAATVAVGRGPRRLAVAADGREAYVTNSDGHSVSVIDLATAAVTATIPVGARPFGIAVGPRLP